MGHFLNSVFLLTLIAFLNSGCWTQSSYKCIEKQKGFGMVVGVSPASIVINHSSFSTVHGYEDELTGNLMGGSYTFSTEDDFLNLDYIQDMAIAKIEVPNKGLVTSDSPEARKLFNQLDTKQIESVTGYHFLIPSIHKHKFSKKTHDLTLTYVYKFPPRKITKQTFMINDQKKTYVAKKTVASDNNDDKLKLDLPDQVYNLKCERLGYFKGNFLLTLKMFLFP